MLWTCGEDKQGPQARSHRNLQLAHNQSWKGGYYHEDDDDDGVDDDDDDDYDDDDNDDDGDDDDDDDDEEDDDNNNNSSSSRSSDNSPTRASVRLSAVGTAHQYFRLEYLCNCDTIDVDRH